MTKFVVGAYPASSAHQKWNPDEEKALFSLLTNDLRIGALELPWMGKLHPHDTEWLIENYPKNLDAIITTIPFVMKQMAIDPYYGISSTNSDSRLAAISNIRDVLDAVNKLHERSGRAIVKLIEIHSAPRQFGDPTYLTESLVEISSWDWGDVAIAIEHCDAFIADQSPEKGFLSLEEEIAAIGNSSTNIGIFINWGRSAIELRGFEGVEGHIKRAKEANLLRGLIFSGASDRKGLFGEAWTDAHLPFKKSPGHTFGDPDSLLTDEVAEIALKAAGEVPWLGIKMGWAPGVSGTVDQRYQMISEALDSL